MMKSRNSSDERKKVAEAKAEIKRQVDLTKKAQPQPLIKVVANNPKTNLSRLTVSENKEVSKMLTH